MSFVRTEEAGSARKEVVEERMRGRSGLNEPALQRGHKIKIRKHCRKNFLKKYKFTFIKYRHKHTIIF